MSVVRLLIVLFGALLPVSALAQTQDTSQFGLSGIGLACFSPRRAFAESSEGKAGIATLTALQDKKAPEIEARNKALQAQEQALQQSLAALNDDAKTQRTNDMDQFRLDTQRFIEDAQAEFLGVQRDIEGAFAIKLRPAVEQVAKSKGIQLIFNLDAGTMIWADPSLDITDDVVKQLALAATR